MIKHKFPYTNFHDLNLDWIVSKLGELKKVLEDSIANRDETKQYADESKLNAEASENNAESSLESFNNTKAIEESLNGSLAKIQENTNNIEIANDRIDTIIALPTGSTTGDAELIDGRIGYDGVQYSTIGDAIRGQFEDISYKEDVIIGASEFTLGGINADGTDAVSSARSRTQSYYRASKGDTLNSTETGNWGVYEYNDDGVLLYHHSGWLNVNSTYVVTQDCLIRVLEQTTTPSPINFNRKISIRKTSLNDDTYNASELAYYHLHSDVVNLNENTCELLNIALDEFGYDGNASSIRTSSNYIPCSYRDLIKYNAGGTNPQYNVFFFDKNKTFISKIAETGTWFSYATFITIPLNAKYFRIMQNTSNREWATFDYYQFNKLDKYALDYDALKDLEETSNKANEWQFTNMIDGSHRGYMAEAPENTRASFILAKNKGYNTLEADVRLTRDNKFVISHNDAMPSSSSYLISEHTLNELRANANMGSYKGIVQELLTLKDLLVIAKNIDMKLFLEFKSTLSASQYAEVVAMIVNLGLIDKVWLMVDSTTVDYVRNVNDKIMIAWFNADESDATSIASYNIDGEPMRNIVYRRCDILTEQFISTFNALNIYVVGWSVSWSWMYGDDYDIAVVKNDIIKSIENGSQGIIMDIFTLNDLMKEYYSNYN